jgi:hypothetical protein
MTRFALLSLAFLAGTTAAAAAAQDSFDLKKGVTPNQPSAQALARKVNDCAGERFVFAWGAGADPTKVTLCSDPGASPDEIAAMLSQGAAKIEATKSIAEDRRIALVQQIRAKIEEVRARKKAVSDPSLPVEALRSNVPALPKPLPPRAVQASGVSPALLARPQLGFHCYTPGEIGTGGECVTLNRDTRITVKAGEPLKDAVTVRYIRNGEFRAETALGALRKGQSLRFTLPTPVCKGVPEAEIELEITRAGRVVGKEGPFLLHC